MTFGTRLRESRKSKGFTQKELANQIGAKHNSISDWENDKNKPDPDTIELLCGVLDITPNYLLNTNSEDFSPQEYEIIKKYRTLDKYGQELVSTILDKEYERNTDVITSGNKIAINIANKPKPTNPKVISTYLNAAHERTDIDIPEGIDISENDIMDDENF